jgi:signal transduction histidine kinase
MLERLRSRLGATSLGVRLGAALAAIVVVAGAVIFVALYRGTGAEVRSQIERDLSTEETALSAQVGTAAPRGPEAMLRRARRSIAAEPAFGPSSRLLLVQVPGAGLATNEPELIGLGRGDPEESRADRRSEAGEAASIRSAPEGTSTVSLEDAGDVLLQSRSVGAPPDAHAKVTVGQPLAPVDNAQAGFARTFLIAGLLTLAAALALALLTAARTSAPLRRIAGTAERVDAGDLGRRLPSTGPRETRQLAESFNHMLDRLQDAFARERSFAADASHELRTPLTAVRGQIEVLARSPAPSREDIATTAARVETEIARMDRLVDDLLLLARSDEGIADRTEEIEPAVFIPEAVAGLAHGSRRRVEVHGIPDGTLRGDPDRLAQVLGNLVRNALEHTGPDGLVAVSAVAAGHRLRVFVDDDGPGIPPGERTRVFDRFHRGTAARARSGGSGLGLAIARAIVEAHGGRIWAAASPAGGARVTFELPDFERGVAQPV